MDKLRTTYLQQFTAMDIAVADWTAQRVAKWIHGQLESLKGSPMLLIEPKANQSRIFEQQQPLQNSAGSDRLQDPTQGANSVLDRHHEGETLNFKFFSTKPRQLHPIFHRAKHSFHLAGSPSLQIQPEIPVVLKYFGSSSPTSTSEKSTTNWHP